MNESDYRRLANALPQIVWTCDAEGRLDWVNDRWTELTGLSAAETLSDRGGLVAIHPDDRHELLSRRRQGLAASAPFEVECRIRTEAGGYRWHLARVAPVRREDSALVCWVGGAFDIQDRRQAEDALHANEAALRRSETQARARADELAVLMDAVPAAVWISQDPDCRQMSGNQAGYELLRIDPGQNLSKSAEDPTTTRHFQVFTNGTELPVDELPLQRAARGIEIRNWEEELRFADGQVVHLCGSAVPLRDPSGAPRGAIGAFVDVTRLKQAEAALREADRRKDEFLALLSHELRNPLAPILTAAQHMQIQGVEDRFALEVIIRQTEHLVRLVDDLLDVSRMARGKVTLTKRPLELASVVARAVEATEPLLDQRRHTLSVSVPGHGLPIEADELRLTQVVSNLLTNAARYTPPGGRVEVSAVREGDEVVLRVADSGVGIDAALLPNVFDMFVQGERGPDRADGGLGLGLSLARTLTALHGGTVSAHSEGPGRGSEFTLRLPALARVPPAHDTPATTTPRARRRRRAGACDRRVLVVDDNRDGARMIANLLTSAGHEVQTANDPSEALSLVRTFHPQIAILDIGLPVMDGYSLGNELRVRLAQSPPILIALSGYGQPEHKRRSEEAHFAFHLVKPIDAKMLLHLLDDLIG